MAGRIPKSFIDELIARVDIVELIGSRVQLKKAGRSYKACCPFHNEKTASFNVHPEKQFFHCFGCGVHGTAVGFLMDYDHLSYVEAIEELAARVGLDIPREASFEKRDAASGDNLYDVNEHAAQFYRECLKSEPRAIAYLKQRGLTGETAAQFAIGYAPDSWNAVLKKMGATEPARRSLSAAGLIVERSGAREARDSVDSGHYDRFRDRIMFPIRDARGRVIAFGGRVLDKGEPKYLNSPETPVFHKGRELYGLYEVRQNRQALKRLLIVEGYMDVVRLHQAGIGYAAATLGTATTTEHLNRIFKLTSEVVFCFDGDRAGRAAAWRALENALPQASDGRQIRFLFLPEGQDPDSLVGAEGREDFEARLDRALPLSEYLVDHLASQVDTENVDGRNRLAELVRPLLERLPQGGVYRELLMERLAARVGLTATKLLSWLEKSPADRQISSASAKSSLSGQRPVTRVAAAGLSAGRGSLVRQAIGLVLNFPETVRLVTGIDRLEGIQNPGVPLLLEMATDLLEHPAVHKAVVLERWRERPEYVHLSKLALIETPLADAHAAARELQTVIQTILDDWQPLQRTDELIEKERLWGLSKQELLELNELLKSRSRGAT